jgi:hypothetical protein
VIKGWQLLINWWPEDQLSKKPRFSLPYYKFLPEYVHIAF